MCSSTPVTLQMDYTLYGKVSYCLPKYGVLEQNSSFNTDVLLELLVRNEVLEALQAELTEISAGKIQISLGTPSYADFSSVLKIL